MYMILFNKHMRQIIVTQDTCFFLSFIFNSIAREVQKAVY